MRICIAIIALALVARAETYTLTNGVPVSGTVVSSIVAQVVIKTPLGQLRQIPVAAFSKADRSRLPEDAAGIYVNCMKAREIASDMIESNQRLTDSSSKIMLQGAGVSEQARALVDKNYMLAAEVAAWKEANELKDATATDRRLFVVERLMKASEEVKR